jgi:hypothetical protein
MPIELAGLATALVTKFLLPYVKQGAEKIAEKVAEKVGEGVGKQAAELAKKVWDRVSHAFQSEKDQKTLDLFKDDPETFQSAVEKILQQKLEQDAAMAKELNEMANTPSVDGSGVSVGQIMADVVGIVDARGAQISGGIVAGAIGSMPQPPKPPAPSPDEKDQ